MYILGLWTQFCIRNVKLAFRNMLGMLDDVNIYNFTNLIQCYVTEVLVCYKTG